MATKKIKAGSTLTTNGTISDLVLSVKLAGIETEDLAKELVRRGFHIVPRRCTTCGGNSDLVFMNDTLYCVECGELETECNC